MILVNVFRGQGCQVVGRDGYAVVWKIVSPTEVVVKMRSGFETVHVGDLLPVSAIETVAQRFEEREIELELEDPIRHLNNAIVPDVSYEESGEEAAEEASDYEEAALEAKEI